ncbi:MAG: energy transducer TonB [Verrucomicrobia bacterium]|nr:energy transducer TonB [Verrucomicrobiota bacterium]
MADHDLRRSFRSRDGAPFTVFLVLSLAINGVGAYCGWWFKFPEPPLQKEDTIQLTVFDTNEVEKLGDPNPPEEQPLPPEPEPTPPAEREPTPPPLDKPPEFEIPQAKPTPRPSAAPSPENSPKPHPASTPHSHSQPTVRPAGASTSHLVATPGLTKGNPAGASEGTGNGGARSGLLVRSPRPPYPSQALQMHISGDVHVTMTVQGGNIVDAEGSGPPLLASAAARWVRANWKFNPATNGTYTLPVSFILH